MTRDARLSALRPAADRSQRAPRSQVIVPGGRGPYLPGRRLQAAAAGRHTSLRLQDRLRRRPSMSEAANLLAWRHFVVNSYIHVVAKGPARSDLFGAKCPLKTGASVSAITCCSPRRPYIFPHRIGDEASGDPSG